MTDPLERCSFEFDPEVWVRENDRTCFVDDDEEILTENADGNTVWRCPHEAADGEAECVFHLPRNSAAKPDAETVTDTFLDITNGEREALNGDGLRPARFLGAAFESLDLDTVRIGDGRIIDLRHAEVGSAEWKVGTVESELLDARGLSVRSEWDCGGVTFGGRARFSGTEFGGRAKFNKAEFEEGATFTVGGWYPISQFQDTAEFSDVTADGPLRFVDEYGSPPGQPYTFLGEVDFEGADIPEAEFIDVSFRETPTFEGTNLTRANLAESDFSGAVFNDALLSQASLYGTDLTNARLYGARMDGAHVSDHTDFGVRNQKGTKRSSAIPFRKPKPGVWYDERNPEFNQVADTEAREDAEGGTHISDHTRAAAVYAEIERVAEVNADSELASRCYLWRKDMQRKRYWSDEGRGNNRELGRGLLSGLANVSVRYGESPWRVTGIAGLVILICAVLYHFFDLIEYSTSPSQSALLSAVGGNAPDPVVTFFDAIYFSTLTFSTLGMGTFQPSSQWGRAVAIFETLSGVVLLALLVFTLGRRATR